MKKKVLELKIYTREDFTDQSLVEYLKQKEISIQEYAKFLSQKKLSNIYAEKVIRFICEYDNGFLKPDKCDAHEPVREIFDEKKLCDPIRWISQPGGAFYFKKIRGFKVDGVIENLKFAPIWAEEKLVEPKIAEPVYKGEMRLFFDETIVKIKDFEYLINLVKEINKVVNGNIGLLTTTDEAQGYDINQLKNGQIIVSDYVKRMFSHTH
jgi:hypothetical protein